MLHASRAHRTSSSPATAATATSATDAVRNVTAAAACPCTQPGGATPASQPSG